MVGSRVLPGDVLSRHEAMLPANSTASGSATVRCRRAPESERRAPLLPDFIFVFLQYG
jgi:hypothetical protein